MATTIQEALAICNANLTGDLKTDIPYLEGQVRRYAHEPNGEELAKRITELAFSLLPKEQQDQFMTATTLNGKRLDELFHEARELLNQEKYQEAAVSLRALTAKCEEGFGKESKLHYFSFRNPFEYHLYRMLYPGQSNIERAPYDFAMYYTLYGYALVELGKLDDAIEALEQGIRFNPVSCDVRFELAEVYKLKKEPEKLLAVIRELFPIANSTYAMSRIYADLGFYAIAVHDYDAAVCFFYESLVYNNHPGVQAELVNLRGLMGHNIEPPTRKQVLAVFEKYELPAGPNEELIRLALVLAKTAVQDEQMQLGAYFYSIAYDLTRDPEIKKQIDAIRAAMTPEESKQA
ncbi:tetratricopeptide repeat protein [Ruminococcus champanellensis]|uniref:Uncharacterized protein n=1 Tax=Ruminococcus champanellensis (strain DSM 18848 / JCM 17042 / KCTC 15320 / 18P13) TaxID=213810 RepID=D4LBF8_RUMC1|nr:tetratricopeptide repeat protein [Ruminococcus champanellensis]CBL16953.1 hypothetical protein RUM_07570 [Ruminococcus champanellensis 18P13 = JCM 17042]